LTQAPGETVDVEYTPDRPGHLMLEFGAGPRFPYIFGRLRFAAD
jgi:hypothetical protein